MVPLSFIEISERLKKTVLPEIDLVIGIGTGGVPAATFVAFHLNAELKVMVLNYRDEQNNPRYDSPKIIQKADWDLDGKKILLVDDVMTTGATASAVTRTLLAGGAGSVDVLTLGRVLRPFPF